MSTGRSGISSGRVAGDDIPVSVILMFLFRVLAFLHIAPGFLLIEHQEQHIVEATIPQFLLLAGGEKVRQGTAIRSMTNIGAPHEALKEHGRGNRKMPSFFLQLLLEKGLDVISIFWMHSFRGPRSKDTSDGNVTRTFQLGSRSLVHVMDLRRGTTHEASGEPEEQGTHEKSQTERQVHEGQTLQQSPLGRKDQTTRHSFPGPCSARVNA